MPSLTQNRFRVHACVATRLLRSLLLTIFLCSLYACSLPESGAQRLATFEKIYVVLEASSIDSLNSALTPSLSNYGQVTQRDFVPVFKQGGAMVNGSEDYVPLIYTDPSRIPANLLFMPMRPRQLFEAVLAKQHMAVIVDKDTAQQFVVTRKEMESLLPQLPSSEALPLEVRKTF